MKYPYNTRCIKLENSGNIKFIDEGNDNQTLLFIHGLANYALGWKKNIETLSKSYRCIAIDLPGNGLSEGGDFNYGIEYYTHIIGDFIKQLSLKNLTLVGHSMGGQIAINTALIYPQSVDKLVLCAPAGFEQFTQWEATMYHTSISMFDYFSSEENNLRNSIKSSFYHYSHQADDMISDLISMLKLQPHKEYRRMIDASIYSMLHEPVFHQLHLITQPVLILFGDRDALIPNKVLHPVTTKKIAEEGAAKIKNAEMHILPQSGHFIQWEKSELVNNYIRKFLA